MEGGELAEFSREGTGEVRRRELKREKAERWVFVEREIGPCLGGERRVAGERGGISECPFEATPLAEWG